MILFTKMFTIIALSRYTGFKDLEKSPFRLEEWLKREVKGEELHLCYSQLFPSYFSHFLLR